MTTGTKKGFKFITQKRPKNSPRFKCKKCGEMSDSRYMDPTGTNMRTRKLCFNCNFWYDVAQQKDRFLIVNGHCYCVGPEDSLMRGFDGARFVFKTLTGETIESTNVFSQGPIPDRWRSQLKDNAIIEKGL